MLEIRSHSGPDIIFAFAQLESGRVFQKQGDTPKARIAYQNFLASLERRRSQRPPAPRSESRIRQTAVATLVRSTKFVISIEFVIPSKARDLHVTSQYADRPPCSG